MRWLFLFVLLVNVAYVGWEYTHPEKPASMKAGLKNVPPIVLLSELDSDGGQPARAEEPPAAAKPEMGAADAGLVSQQQVEPEPGVEDGSVTQAAPVAAATQAQACFTLGPFRKLEKLRAYTRAIKDYVVDASFRSREEKEQSMFWVSLPPRADREKAKALGKRLEKMKIKDYYIISKGEDKNAISLGHFKERDRAFSYADKIGKLGFKTRVEPVYRSYTIYWLDYRTRPGVSIPDEIYDQHLVSNVKRLDRPCS